MSILYKSRSERNARDYVKRHNLDGFVRITLIGCKYAVITKA